MNSTAPAAFEPSVGTGLVQSYPETRIGAFDFYVATCTEPLGYRSADGQRACGDSRRGVTEDLFLFSQEDPILFAGGMHFYRYGMNRPGTMTDPSGLWSTRNHNEILERAFEGVLSQNELKIVEAASFYADKFQDPSFDAWHAMRQAWQSPGDAEEAYKSHVCSQKKRALAEKKEGFVRSGNSG